MIRIQRDKDGDWLVSDGFRTSLEREVRGAKNCLYIPKKYREAVKTHLVAHLDGGDK